MDNQGTDSDNVQTEVPDNEVLNEQLQTNEQNQTQEQSQNQPQEQSQTQEQSQPEKKYRVVLMVRYNTNLNARPDEQTVKNYFSSYGEVVNVFFPKLQTNNAFVFMKTLNNNTVRNAINIIRQECNNSFTVDVAHRPNIRPNEGSAFVPRTNFNIQQNNSQYINPNVNPNAFRNNNRNNSNRNNTQQAHRQVSGQNYFNNNQQFNNNHQNQLNNSNNNQLNNNHQHYVPNQYNGNQYFNNQQSRQNQNRHPRNVQLNYPSTNELLTGYTSMPITANRRNPNSNYNSN